MNGTARVTKKLDFTLDMWHLESRYTFFLRNYLKLATLYGNMHAAYSCKYHPTNEQKSLRQSVPTNVQRNEKPGTKEATAVV